MRSSRHNRGSRMRQTAGMTCPSWRRQAEPSEVWYVTARVLSRTGKMGCSRASGHDSSGLLTHASGAHGVARHPAGERQEPFKVLAGGVRSVRLGAGLSSVIMRGCAAIRQTLPSNTPIKNEAREHRHACENQSIDRRGRCARKDRGTG